MKIGILTWFFAANYGAKAHSLALQKKIIELGHECELIDYNSKKINILNYKMNMGREYSDSSIYYSFRGLVRYRKFNKGNKRYIISRKVKSAIEIDNLNYDMIILGSDEIFNINHPIFDSVYFGVGLKTPCFTYAPSSGQTNINSQLDKEIVDSIDSMHHVSVRDYHTKMFLNSNINKEIEIVLDPTFLYDFKDEMGSFEDYNYILVYSFSSWNEYSDSIKKYADKMGYKIISVGRHLNWADKSYDTISFEKWLASFKKAKMVVTDSFHGTVFALKNRKELILLGRADKINKISDLLSFLNINRSFFENKQGIEEYINHPLDFNLIEKKIKIEVDKAVSFIKAALDEGRR